MYQVNLKKLRRDWECFKALKGHYPQNQAERMTCKTDAKTRSALRLHLALSPYKRRKTDGALTTSDWINTNTARATIK